MFVRVWGTLFDFLLSVKVLCNMNPPSKVWQSFGCSPCWCIHWSFSQWDMWEGRGGPSTGPRHRCVTSSGRVTPAEHSSTGLAMGIEAQVNQDSTKGWADRPVNPQVCCTSFIPFVRFFQAKPKLWCVHGAKPKAAKLSTRGQPGITKACGGSPRPSTLSRGVFKSFQGPAVSCLRCDNFTGLQWKIWVCAVAEVLGCWMQSLPWLVLKQTPETVPVWIVGTVGSLPCGTVTASKLQEAQQ